MQSTMTLTMRVSSGDLRGPAASTLTFAWSYRPSYLPDPGPRFGILVVSDESCTMSHIDAKCGCERLANDEGVLGEELFRFAGERSAGVDGDDSVRVTGGFHDSVANNASTLIQHKFVRLVDMSPST